VTLCPNSFDATIAQASTVTEKAVPHPRKSGGRWEITSSHCSDGSTLEP
jgi:hypothetical protein